jgi:hypothetical protein
MVSVPLFNLLMVSEEMRVVKEEIIEWLRIRFLFVFYSSNERCFFSPTFVRLVK